MMWGAVQTRFCIPDTFCAWEFGKIRGDISFDVCVPLEAVASSQLGVLSLRQDIARAMHPIYFASLLVDAKIEIKYHAL